MRRDDRVAQREDDAAIHARNAQHVDDATRASPRNDAIRVDATRVETIASNARAANANATSTLSTSQRVAECAAQTTARDAPNGRDATDARVRRFADALRDSTHATSAMRRVDSRCDAPWRANARFSAAQIASGARATFPPRAFTTSRSSANCEQRVVDRVDAATQTCARVDAATQTRDSDAPPRSATLNDAARGNDDQRRVLVGRGSPDAFIAWRQRRRSRGGGKPRGSRGRRLNRA